MEQFVKALHNRLASDSVKQMKLICIMDNAINEMHNSGIVYRVSEEVAKKIHSEDPNERVTEKTSLAKSVGYGYVVASQPKVTEKGIAHIIQVNYDDRFPNSIAICIQGGLEGLYQSGIYKKNPSGKMEYHILIDDNGKDVSKFIENCNVLNDLYDEFEIKCVLTKDLLKDSNSNENDKKPHSKKEKKSLFLPIGIAVVVILLIIYKLSL